MVVVRSVHHGVPRLAEVSFRVNSETAHHGDSSQGLRTDIWESRRICQVAIFLAGVLEGASALFFATITSGSGPLICLFPEQHPGSLCS